MLKLVLPPIEGFNEETNEFLQLGEEIELSLEHSLISLSKWESQYQVPFLSKAEKSPEEVLDYVYHMILTPEIGKEVLGRINQSHLDQVNAYIESKESATTFGFLPERKGPGETITSELIYYWMVAFTIPFECENWHLNRLFSLIKICHIKSQKPTRMSAQQIAERNRALNAERRARLGTKG